MLTRREMNARYYIANRERINAVNKVWRDQNKEASKAKATVYRRNNPVAFLLKDAKRRAKAKGLPFDVTVDDLPIPDVCPILGVKLISGVGIVGPHSPSIDRIEPALGYVRGNVAIISHRANTIKGSMSRETIERLFRYISVSC